MRVSEVVMTVFIVALILISLAFGSRVVGLFFAGLLGAAIISTRRGRRGPGGLVQ